MTSSRVFELPTRRVGQWAVASLTALMFACSGVGVVDLTAPEYLASVGGEGMPLGDRVGLPGVDEEISYPEGWHAERDGPFTTIAWEPEEIRRWFGGGDLRGPLVFFEVETFGFMRGMGLRETNPDPDDLLAFSVRTFGWEDVRDELRVGLFGGEGIQVRGLDPRGEFLGIVGVLPDERAILVMVIAPDADTLEGLLPTWRDMARSIVVPSTEV